jgi:hypothetical protein
MKKKKMKQIEFLLGQILSDIVTLEHIFAKEKVKTKGKAKK